MRRPILIPLILLLIAAPALSTPGPRPAPPADALVALALLTIEIMHRHGFDRPVDACELRCLAKMEEKLCGLGSPRDKWSEPSPAASDETISRRRYEL